MQPALEAVEQDENAALTGRLIRSVIRMPARAKEDLVGTSANDTILTHLGGMVGFRILRRMPRSLPSNT